MEKIPSDSGVGAPVFVETEAGGVPQRKLPWHAPELTVLGGRKTGNAKLAFPTDTTSHGMAFGPSS